jgi:hypothetical protein
MPSRSNRIFIRLSPKDASAIFTGLNWILSRHQLWIDRKSLPNADPTRRIVPRDDPGVFHQTFMGESVSLRLRILFLMGGGRLQFTTPFQAAHSALAARIAGWLNRHLHQSAWLSPKTRVPPALNRRLEAARKRLKRAFIGTRGSECYRDLVDQWRSHLRWLRTHFLCCWCTRRWQIGSGRYYRRQLAILMARARVGLAGQHIRVSDSEVRRLVRLAIRSVRRDRTSFSFRELVDDPELASNYLANFVVSRTPRGRNRRPTPLR